MKKENNAVIVAVIVLLILLIFGGFGMMGFGNYGGMMNWGYGGFGTMWIFGWLIMSLVVIALVLFIMWLVKQLQNSENHRGRK